MTSSATRRREPRLRPPRADNRQRILDVALELFAARGFDGVSIRDLGDAADVHGATIYHYFGDKQALYELAVRTAVVSQLEEYLKILEGAGDARGRLGGFISNLLQSMIRGDARRQLIERTFAEPDDRAAPFENGPLQARFQEAVIAIIRDLAPGAADMHWVEISGVINGIPHGMMRSRMAHERAGGSAPPMDLDGMSGLLTELVIASFEVVASRRKGGG